MKANKKFSDEEIEAALGQMVKEGKLVKLYNDQGEPVYKDTRYLTPQDLKDIEQQKKDLIPALQENLDLGNMKIVGKNAAGELIFILTEKGKSEVDKMLKENPRLFIEMGLDDGKH